MEKQQQQYLIHFAGFHQLNFNPDSGLETPE